MKKYLIIRFATCFLFVFSVFVFSGCTGVPVNENENGGNAVGSESEEEAFSESENEPEVMEEEITPEDDKEAIEEAFSEPETVSVPDGTRVESGLSSVQIMSAEEASALTGGELKAMPEYDYAVTNQLKYNAYLTPSGKLVYIDDFTYKYLYGVTDFEVTWGLYDKNELNIRTDFSVADKGTVSVSARLDGKTAVKYDLFADRYTGESSDQEPGIMCYAVLSSGTVVFDMGLNLNIEELSGREVKYTVSNGGDPLTITAKVGETAYIESLSRTFPFFSTEWQVTAEVINDDGSPLYSENFTVYETFNPEDNTYFVNKGMAVAQ